MKFNPYLVVTVIMLCFLFFTQGRVVAQDKKKVDSLTQLLTTANYEKALEYFQKSLKLKQDINDTYDLDRLLINIGFCYNNRSRSQEARDYINGGLKICGNTCSDQIKTEALLGLGVSFYTDSIHDVAEKYFFRSYHLAKNLSDKRLQLGSLVQLSSLYAELHKGDGGKKFLMEAELIAEEKKYNEPLIEVYLEFSNLYKQTKDFEKASAYQAKYINLKDSIYSHSLIKNLISVQLEFEELENRTKIEAQKKILSLKEEVIDRQEKLNIVGGIAILLLIGFITLLYNNIRHKKRTNALLERKVRERTHELEIKYDLLQRTYHERSNTVHKTIADIKGPLSTMKGLCALALKELQYPDVQEYTLQIQATTEQVLTVVNRVSLKDN